jgi:hypothetical protein
MQPPGTLLPRLAATALLVVPLGACGGGSEQPTVLPARDRVSASSSASPSATLPSADVEAAVRAYYAALTEAARTNKPALRHGLVAAGCPCAAATKVITKNSRSGRTTPGAAFVVESVRPHDVEGDVAVAEVEYQASAYDVLDRSGDVVSSVDAHRSHLDLSLVRSPAGAWVITNVTDLEG